MKRNTIIMAYSKTSVQKRGKLVSIDNETKLTLTFEGKKYHRVTDTHTEFVGLPDKHLSFTVQAITWFGSSELPKKKNTGNFRGEYYHLAVLFSYLISCSLSV